MTLHVPSPGPHRDGRRAELVPCASVLPVADDDWPADPVAVMNLFLDDAVQALPRLRAAYGHDPADLYLYDIGAYAARALAEAQGRPPRTSTPSPARRPGRWP